MVMPYREYIYIASYKYIDENPVIVRTVYSRIFKDTHSNIQPCSGTLRDIKAYLGIIETYGAIITCIQNSAHAQPLHNKPCHIQNQCENPKHLQKACWICMNMAYYSEPWHSQNSLFKHHQWYLGIIKISMPFQLHWQVHIQLVWRGRPPLPFLKIKKVS